MASLGKIVYLTEAQKNDLFNFGSVTSNNKTITYSPNDLYLTPDGSVSDVKIGDTSLVTNNVATIPVATTTAAGLLSATDKTKLDGIATGATANTGTITGITMNGVSKGTSGVINLGTVITAHQDISGKVNKTNAEFENSVSMGRKANTTIGSGSVAMGVDIEASANSCYAEGGYTTASAQGAHAEGNHTTASGEASHAEGYYTIASGHLSHAEGDLTTASGVASHAEGVGTVAAGALSHVSGIYNIADNYDNWQEWTANTLYAVGDKVKVTSNNTITGYICNTANSDSIFTEANWTNRQGQMNYAEIIGNGTSNINRSNARVLDWEGNETLSGVLNINTQLHNANGVQLSIDSGDCQYHNIYFRKNGETVAKIVVNTGTIGDTISNSRFRFAQFSPKSTADSETTGYQQIYDLPSVTADLTENETYGILTTKNAVTISQGGTGMTGVSTDSVTTNGITASCRKWGKVVQVTLSGTFTATIAQSTNFITLPSGFRPAAAIRPFAKHNGSVDMLYVGTAGGINNADNDCAKKTLYSTFTFIIS